ncbi:MAG: glycerol-3-phosphate 1-O-acyltransferase PlsY [Clostridia bacterium]|nr:glycerol-3-phosphate 1-O-acyltransferase PlsY [Clostridia bacterium]
MVWQLIVIAMAGYLLGSINLSIILSKLMGKGDIRDYGSGNAGTTNTLRVLGVVPAILVFLFDACKGILAIIIGRWLILLGNSIPAENLELAYELAVLVSAAAAIIGHNFPIYYGFKGGKGIATSLGAITMIEWPIGLVCMLFGVIMILASRMVSVGSIIGAILYPVLVLVMGEAFAFPIPYILFACFLAALAIYRHKSNIEKLLNGTENKLWHTKAEKAAMQLEGNQSEGKDNKEEN